MMTHSPHSGFQTYLLGNKGEPPLGSIYGALKFNLRRQSHLVSLSAMGDPLFVLLVEDDEADAACTVRALHATCSAIRVQRVFDCEGALEWLRKSDDDQRRLVLLDWHLPQMSGQEMLRVMGREPKLADIPVVILSGDESEEALNDSYGLGARAFVQKPKNAQGYSDLVREIVRFWEAADLN